MQPDARIATIAAALVDSRSSAPARQALLDVEQELDALAALLSVVGEIGALTEGQLVKITKLDRLTVRERQDRGAGLLDKRGVDKRGVPASWRSHAGSFLSSLGFRDLRLANVRRCETHYHPVSAWSLTDWLTCVAGIDLGDAVRRKFNEVSEKRLSSNIRLEERTDG